jgi:uncharacterized protein (TIGR00251 family)
MDELDVREGDEGVTFRVRVKPRASKSRVLGVREACLEVAVAAPPVDGAANEELRKTLARYFDVARGAVVVEAGEASRTKRVRVRGVSAGDVLAKVARER